MCGHDSSGHGRSNIIRPVKQPEQMGVVMPRCGPLLFDKKDRGKAVFTRSNMFQGFLQQHHTVMFAFEFAFVFSLNAIGPSIT